MKAIGGKAMVIIDRRLLCAIALSVFLVAAMFYVFPSGMPQPADYFFTFVALVLGWSAVRAHLVPRNHALVALVVWILLVNTAWFTLTYESAFLRTTVYYFFNLVVFVIVMYVCWRYPDHATRWLRIAIIVAVIVQLFFILQRSGPGRELGTFNNPNQLGYWSVLMVAMYGVLMIDRKLSWVDFGVLAAGFYACLVSLSIAALVPMLFLAAVFLLVHPARPEVRPVIISLAVILSIYLAYDGGVIRYISNLDATAATESRIDRVVWRGIMELEYRGYDRIWRYPEYLFFGAGEGEFDRFYYGRAIELHSSFGTMVFSYGVVGLFLFLAVLWQAVRGTPLLVKAYFAPVLLYGLTHQGLRFSLFWFLLGLVAATGLHYRARARNPAAGLPRHSGFRRPSLAPSNRLRHYSIEEISESFAQARCFLAAAEPEKPKAMKDPKGT